GAVHPAVALLGKEKKAALADALEGVAWRAVGLAADKAEGATFSQLMTGAGIAIDKMRALRSGGGQSLAEMPTPAFVPLCQELGVPVAPELLGAAGAERAALPGRVPPSAVASPPPGAEVPRGGEPALADGAAAPYAEARGGHGVGALEPYQVEALLVIAAGL